MSFKPLALGLAAAAGMIATAANAAPTFNYAQSASAPSAGFTVVNEFNSLAGLAVTGPVQIKHPPNDANGAAPANSDGSNYLSVLGGGSATYTFAAGTTNFQFDWGSLDNYNTLTIVSSSGTFVFVPGSTSNPTFTTSNGDQSLVGAGLFTASGNGDTFTSVTFASSRNSFEVDKLATTAVPEPATWAMMVLGFAMVGFGLRSRKVSTKVSFA